MTLQWDPPSLNAVTHELRYRVENSNETWNVTSLQNGETRFKLDNLRPNTTYILRITALRNSIRSLPTPLIIRTRISGCYILIMLFILYNSLNSVPYYIATNSYNNMYCELTCMKFVCIFSIYTSDPCIAVT